MSRAHYTSVAVQDIVPLGSSRGEATCFLLRLEHPCGEDGRPLWQGWKPGQFAMLRPVAWSFELTWARPLSICDVHDDSLVFFFQSAGRGTGRMAALEQGDMVNIWGPLGNSFAVETDAPTLVLAGGIGLAPFVGYCRSHPRPEQVRLLFSHRPDISWYPVHLFNTVQPEDRHEKTLQDRQIFLDEVTRAVADTAGANGLVLACGPNPFLAHVQKAALATGCRAQLSLENRMACGVGACLGCVARPTPQHPLADPDGLPLRTCVTGPVFWADQVELEVA